jgi:cystathionine gamma-lyase
MDTIQRPWSLCENLGAVESIITCPAVVSELMFFHDYCNIQSFPRLNNCCFFCLCLQMTHANMLKEDRLKVGITDGFIRVSCGIEDPEDLLKALTKALDNL